MMKNNKRLFKLPLKYHYDITYFTFIGTLWPANKRAIKDAETNAYLTAALKSYHFVLRSEIPQEVFDKDKCILDRFSQLIDEGQLTKLKIPYGADDEVYR